MRHANIAMFVPHAGCPHQCSFCNQKTISGASEALTAEDVTETLEFARKNDRLDPEKSEIAFFGGSFTAIDRAYMLSLLSAAKPYIDGGFFKGVRISTRPDAIDGEILAVLKAYGVTAIELGAQSTDDAVLLRNRRGHTARDIFSAAEKIKAAGFELGLQMMTGLWGSSPEADMKTAQDILSMHPATVRVYPTVVLEDTYLAAALKSGEYIPQTLEEATELCARLLLLFKNAGVRVIRLGLHSGGDVEKGCLAGAYHPAFRELCEGVIYRDKLFALAEKLDKNGEYIFEVPLNSLSKAKGQGKRNEKALRNRGIQCTIKGNGKLKDYDIVVKDSRV